MCAIVKQSKFLVQKPISTGKENQYFLKLKFVMYILVVDQHDILKRNMAAVCTTIAGVFYGIDNISDCIFVLCSCCSLINWIIKVGNVLKML